MTNPTTATPATTTPVEPTVEERAARRARHLLRVQAVIAWAVARFTAHWTNTDECNPAAFTAAAAVAFRAAYAARELLDALAGVGGPQGCGDLIVESRGLNGLIAGGGPAASPWHPGWPVEGMGSGRRAAADGGAYEAAIVDAVRWLLCAPGTYASLVLGEDGDVILDVVARDAVGDEGEYTVALGPTWRHAARHAVGAARACDEVRVLHPRLARSGLDDVALTVRKAARS